MVLHECPRCRYVSNRKTNLRRHMDIMHLCYENLKFKNTPAPESASIKYYQDTKYNLEQLFEANKKMEISLREERARNAQLLLTNKNLEEALRALQSGSNL